MNLPLKWRTPLEILASISLLFTVLYLLAVIITQPDWVADWGVKWPEWLRDVLNALLAVAITILSISYSGILTKDFYSILTGFGISDVRQDRWAFPKVVDLVELV